MNCEFVRKNVQDYLEGRLVSLDRNAFVRHVDECPSCEADVVDYREVFSGLREMARVEAPAGLRGAVVSRLKADGVIRERRVGAATRVLEGFLSLPGAARYPLSALVVVAALYVPLAAALVSARGFAISFTGFVTNVYELAGSAIGGLVLVERLVDSMDPYAKAIGALVRALGTAAGENTWLVGVGAATMLTSVLIVSMVTRRKRSARHATFLF